MFNVLDTIMDELEIFLSSDILLSRRLIHNLAANEWARGAL